MKLENKKELVSRALNIGKGRISFNINNLSDIKEAITKQDIKDLLASGAIIIKPVNGRKTIKKRQNRRRAGSVRMKIKYTKRDYINLTRKLRSYLKHLKFKNQISNEDFLTLRKEIRTKAFRSLSHLKERIAGGLHND